MLVDYGMKCYGRFVKAVILMMLLISGVTAGVVRSYALKPEDFNRYRDWEEPEWTGREMAKAPFESVLFQEGDLLRDWSDKVGKVLGVEQFEGQLTWNERLGRFVLKAELAVHEEFEMAMEGRFVTKMPRITVSIHSFEKRPEWQGKTIWEMLPDGGELVGEISWLAMEGKGNRAVASQKKLVVEADLGFSMDERLEGAFKVKSRLEGAVFSFDGRVDTMVGLPWVSELGSLDGRKTLFLVVGCEWVRSDGTAFDEWVLKEDGQSPLREERLRNAEGYEIEFLRAEKEVRVYRVPGGSLAWLRQPLTNLPKDENGDGNPFFDIGKPVGIRPSPKYQGKHPVFKGVDRSDLVDLSPKMRETGVKIDGDQFVVLRSSTSRLYVRLDPKDVELLMGLLEVACSGPPRPILLEFELVESNRQLTPMEVREGVGKTLRRVVSKVPMGSSGKLTLDGDLLLETEAISCDDGVIEVSALLSEVKGKREKPTFKSSLILKDGVPVMVYESRFEEGWWTWVLKGTVVELVKEGEVKR